MATEMIVEDGGPAFPVSDEESRRKVSAVFGGMTLRDYFAAKAMCGLLADTDYCEHEEAVARRCYMLADAMIAERSK